MRYLDCCIHNAGCRNRKIDRRPTNSKNGLLCNSMYFLYVVKNWINTSYFHYSFLKIFNAFFQYAFLIRFWEMLTSVLIKKRGKLFKLFLNKLSYTSYGLKKTFCAHLNYLISGAFWASFGSIKQNRQCIQNTDFLTSQNLITGLLTSLFNGGWPQNLILPWRLNIDLFFAFSTHSIRKKIKSSPLSETTLIK